MSKQSWRIKLEQWLAANGDEGMPGIVDHLAVLNRAASLMRTPGFKKALEKFLDEWAGLPEQKEDPVLRRLFEDEAIIIAPTDGSQFIGNAKDVFKGYISPDFKGRDLNKCGASTKATNVSVHEMIKEATFAKMFSSLGAPDLNALCLSQDQIVEFCKNHSKWLKPDGNATFFLFKENENFFVAGVNVRSDGLLVSVLPFEYDCVWAGGSRPRLVVPQLTV